MSEVAFDPLPLIDDPDALVDWFGIVAIPGGLELAAEVWGNALEEAREWRAEGTDLDDVLAAVDRQDDVSPLNRAMIEQALQVAYEELYR